MQTTWRSEQSDVMCATHLCALFHVCIGSCVRCIVCAWYQVCVASVCVTWFANHVVSAHASSRHPCVASCIRHITLTFTSSLRVPDLRVSHVDVVAFVHEVRSRSPRT